MPIVQRQRNNNCSLVAPALMITACFSACARAVTVVREYLWKDESAAYRKPTRIPAPLYVDLMMAEIDAQITDENIFPVEESQGHTHKHAHAPRALVAIGSEWLRGAHPVLSLLVPCSFRSDCDRAPRRCGPQRSCVARSSSASS